jgi:hypothetical protein
MVKRILLTALLAVVPAWAVPDTTTIKGIVYLPGGNTPATTGSIIASLSSSCQVGGDVVAGRVAATITAPHCSVTTTTLCSIDADCPGVETCLNVTIALVPNDICAATGTYYTVQYSVGQPTSAQWSEKWTVVSAPDPIAIGSVTRIDMPPGMAAPVSTIQNEGTAVTKRTKLNMVGAGVDCVDDSTNSRTTCTVTSGGGGGTPGGSSQDVQINNSSAFGNAPGFTANTTTGAVKAKVLNEVRYANNCASGSGTTASPWPGSCISDAWADLPAASGGTVVMMPGVYNLGSGSVGLNLDNTTNWRAGFTLQGSSGGNEADAAGGSPNEGATVLIYSGTGEAIRIGSFSTAGGNHWLENSTLRGFKVRQTGTAGTGIGILARLFRWGRFEDVTVQDFSVGVALASVSDFNTFDGLRSHDNRLYGVDLGRTTDAAGNSLGGTGGQCNSNRFTHCDIKNSVVGMGFSNYGIYVHANTVGNVFENSEFHNFDTTGSAAIRIEDEVIHSNVQSVSRNYFESCYTGVYHNNAFGAGTDQGTVSIKDNYFAAIRLYGVWINSGGVTGITDGVVVENNRFDVPSASAPYNNAIGVQLGNATQNVRVVGNSFSIAGVTGTLPGGNIKDVSTTITENNYVKGTSRFTGTVTAPTFIGALTGTAPSSVIGTTASQWATGYDSSNKMTWDTTSAGANTVSLAASSAASPLLVIKPTTAAPNNDVGTFILQDFSSRQRFYFGRPTSGNAANQVLRFGFDSLNYMQIAGGSAINSDTTISTQNTAGANTKSIIFSPPLTFSAAVTHGGLDMFNAGATFAAGATAFSITPAFNAGYTAAASTVLAESPGTASSTTAANHTVQPTTSFPGVAAPPTWLTGTDYRLISTCVGASNPVACCTGAGVGTCASGVKGTGGGSTYQYKLITSSCTSGATVPTTQGHCSTTTSTICIEPDGTNDYGECPGAETCVNSISDGTCAWRYIGLVHSGAARDVDFMYQAGAGAGNDVDGIGGGDGEFIRIRGYNATDGSGGRLDSTEYAWFEQWTDGWTGGTSERRAEFFQSHVTPGGTMWHPWAENISFVASEKPRADLTFNVSPTQIGFQNTPNGYAIGGAANGYADLEVYGTNGSIFLKGAANRIQAEGTTVDANSTSILFDTPTNGGRAVSVPTVAADSRFVVSSQVSTNGPAAWAANGVSCATACTNIGQPGCADSIPLDGTNTALGNCTGTIGNRVCQCY